jgi:hypothetical protein
MSNRNRKALIRQARRYRLSTSRFQNTDMVSFAVNIAKTTAINFCRIYQRDTIYPSFSLPRSYPHFFEERFACDYLNNTIKT